MIPVNGSVTETPSDTNEKHEEAPCPLLDRFIWKEGDIEILDSGRRNHGVVRLAQEKMANLKRTLSARSPKSVRPSKASQYAYSQELHIVLEFSTMGRDGS